MSDDLRDARTDPRANVFLTAILYAGAPYPVRIRNLSVHGALLEADSLPPEGATVRLQRGSLGALGEVAWQIGKHCGIRFNGRITLDEWVRRAGPKAQQ